MSMLWYRPPAAGCLSVIRGANILTLGRPTQPDNRASLLSFSLLRDEHSVWPENCWPQSKMQSVHNIPKISVGKWLLHTYSIVYQR